MSGWGDAARFDFWQNAGGGCVTSSRNFMPVEALLGGPRARHAGECSNHSVPTLFFNDLAQSSLAGHR